jgi:hypothetical protein
MERHLNARFRCVVCGAEAHRHLGWFLVVENTWLDRVKILVWHPVLARQASMQSVCGEQHLKTLLTHWLTHANLKFFATGVPSWPAVDPDDFPEGDSITMSVGRFVGELAVHRESLSRVWTGSAQALECIVSALVEGITDRRQKAECWRVSQAEQAPTFAIRAGSGV